MAFFGKKTYGAGNDTWLDSRHGVDTPKTGTLKISAFTAPDGYIPSGTPVVQGTAADADYLVPAPTDGTAAPIGFVLGDFPIESGSLDGVGLPVGYIWHGRIKTQNLPVATFTVPTAPGLFSYVGGNKGA